METGLFSKRNLIIMGVVLIVGALVGLNIYRVNEKEVIPVNTKEVQQKKLVQTVLASGKVAAAQKEVVYAQVTGTVKKIHVKLGDTVKPGQVLISLDIPDAEQRLLQARAAVANAEAALIKAGGTGGKSLEIIEAESAYHLAENNFRLAQESLARNQELYQEGAISTEQWEIAQTDLDAKEQQYLKARTSLKAVKASAGSSLQALKATYEGAKASRDLVEKQTSQRGITASMNGQVMSIPVNEGDLITVNMPLISIGNLQDLVVKAEITEADAAKIGIGQKTLITAGALPDEKYYGQVKEMGLEAVSAIKNSSETTAIPVVISINKGGLLRPGFNVDLEITTDIQKKALVFPYEALVEKKGATQVYVVRDNTAHLQKVKTGISDNLVVQAVSGLKKGDKVVLNPSAKLKDGSKVKANDKDK